MESSTLIKLLSDRRQLAGVGITFIEGSDQERFLSYDQLYHSALKVLSVLQRKGMQDGDELVIQIQDNRTFIIAFWACLLGGIVPVPLSVGQNDNHREKVYTIWPVLKNPHLITAEDNFTRLGAFARSNGFERTFSGIADKTVKEPEIWLSSSEGKVFDAKPDDIAFVQFSSGSTGNPRGVMLTHRNLLTNIGAIERAARYTKSDSTISWMPLTHDMGLIGFHLNPLFSKINQFLIPTANFIRRPALWLDKVNEHRVTILCSPNFGYKYLLKHIQPDTGKNWDLSCVRVLYNGAEPISGKLCREFLARMAVHGLPGNAMCPVYGLAEASLAVTVSGLDDEVMSINADRNKLNAGDRITSVWEEDKNAVAIVNVGRVVADCILRIADDDDKPVEKDVIGHIQIKGENVTAGYYNNKAETRKIITGDGWLRTGDLGFIKEGSLYITGRAKDIFFVNGQNFYPHDIEQLAQEVEGIELNKIVVAGLPADDLQTEEVIAFILHRGSLADLLPLMASLKEHINSKAGIELDRIIPVKDIPRTTSGKLQRYKLIEQLRKGDFADIGKKVQALTEAAGQIAPAPSAAAAGNEQILLQIWQRVLGTGNIGVTQRFFEIGGNSLKAAEVAMILSKEFQAELPMELLYEKQTIRELASEIGFPGKGGYSPIPEGPRNECHPLSWAQKRIYYFAELNKTSIAYNVPVALRIRGHVNVGRLENNINELIARHDVLRMSFPIAGEPVFRVNEDIKVRVDRIACDEDRIDEELRAQVRPFNLAIAPLFSVRLLELKGKEEYILFLDFHHIIADGMSVYQFIDELFGSYSGNRLPALSVDYKDYVYWEKDSEQSKEIGRQQAFWLGELQGDLQLLDMPADFSRGAILSTEGAKLAFQINGETVTRLKQVAAANTCTLHVLLFSLYAVLLSKLTGQREVIIGVPVAGRRHPDLQKMIGMFVNNLAVKSSIDGDETLVQLLARQKEKMLAAFANQEYPFEQLIQDLGPTPDSSRNPVFDSMFIYQNMGFPDISTANLGVSPYFFDPGISKFDISMEVFERGESISYYIEYPTKLFKRETILRFAEYFDNLIGHAAGNSREKLADWSLMNERTYFRCVTAFNATERDYPGGSTIHRLFREQVFRTPDNIAIEYKEKGISYKELYDKAGSLSVLLREQGVGPHTIAAVLLQRSPELIIGILAVLMAGGCYLPIEPGLPDERIGLLLGQSRCGLVITEDSYISRLSVAGAYGVTVIDVNRTDLWAPRPGMMEDFGCADDPAYVIYTSGTTGRPKGVMIAHRSLVNYIWWAAATYIKEPEAVFPLYTSVAFDLTVTSIFTPLITGNKIVVYNEEERDLLIRQVVIDNKCTIVKLTPSHLKILAAGKIPAESRIKRFIVGGEQLETSLAQEIYDRYSGQVEICNEYGPTEATVGCMIHSFVPGETAGNVPIGVAAANMRVYILDKYLKPVAAGVHGELYVSGDGIAMGYLFMEELTKEKFVSDPFSEGRRMYRTGDIARWLPEGVMEYLGRVDEQVKINGYRIEPAEIVHCLRSHPRIAEAVVTIKAGTGGTQFLCAHIKLKEQTDRIDAEAELRSYMAGKLPYYMIPASFVVIDEIPLTKNGKIDHSALPAPVAGDGRRAIYPRSELENIVTKVWEEVLEQPALSVNDNFFAFGGDSIKAVQIASRLLDKGIPVHAKDILIYHTIEQLCLHTDLAAVGKVYEQGPVEGSKGLIPIESWFFAQQFTNPDFFTQSILLGLNKTIDKGLLERAFEALIRHHDGLRLNCDPGREVLFYHADFLRSPFVIGSYETGDGSGDDDLAGICREIKNGFCITDGLLLRSAIIKDAAMGQFLFITAHHLVVDGMSWRILLEDLYTLYTDLEKGIHTRLPRKTASLTAWRQKWEEFARQHDTEEVRKYWEEIEKTRFSIPLDADTEDWEARNREEVSGLLNRNVTTALLKEAYSAYKSDTLVFLSTALALTLRAWTQSEVLVVEYEGHGRHPELIDTSRTIGWFTEMYPVRFELPGGNAENELKAIKNQLRNATDRGAEYGVTNYFKAKKGGTALTEIRFNYLGQFSTELDNDLFTYSFRSTGSDIDPRNRMTAKLELVAMIINGELRVQLYYNRRAHTRQTVRSLIDDFFNNLNRIVSHIKEKNDVFLTASDFDAAGLDDEELNVLFS